MTLTTKALDDAAHGLSGYLLAQFMVNASFGVIVGVGVWLIGLPYPLLWGVCSTFLRYIPFVGPWLALMFPLTLSLAVMPGWQTARNRGDFRGLRAAANLAIEPLLYGQKMGVCRPPCSWRSHSGPGCGERWAWFWPSRSPSVWSSWGNTCLPSSSSISCWETSRHSRPTSTFIKGSCGAIRTRRLKSSALGLSDSPLEQVFDEIVVPALISARLISRPRRFRRVKSPRSSK